jgi:hypothetical protein
MRMIIAGGRDFDDYPLLEKKCREVLKVQPDDGFLIIKEEQYDRAALARCVRLATQNAYLTLQSGLAVSEDNDSKEPAPVRANDG